MLAAAREYHSATRLLDVAREACEIRRIATETARERHRTAEGEVRQAEELRDEARERYLLASDPRPPTPEAPDGK